MNFIHRTLQSLLPVRSFSRPVKLLLVATVIDGVIFSFWSLFFNFYILSAGYDKQFLGWVNSLPSIASFILGVPLGMLSDRIGRRPSMLIGIVVGCVAMGLQVTAPVPWLILVVSFLAGAGNTLYTNSQSPFIMKVSTAENRALLFSLNFGIITLSGAVGNAFAGQLPRLFSDLLGAAPDSAAVYQAILVASVLLGSLSLVPIFFIKEPPRSLDEAQMHVPAASSVWQAMTRPVVVKVLSTMIIIGLGAGLLIPYLNVFFSETWKVSSETLGVLFALSALFTGIGSIIGPKIAAKLQSKIKTVVYTQALSLLFFVFLGFGRNFALVAVSFLARAVLMNMANPLYAAFSLEQVNQKEQGLVNSLINAGWLAGQATGMTLSGLVQRDYGFSPLFVITITLYAIATGMIWFFFRNVEPVRVTERAEAKAAG